MATSPAPAPMASPVPTPARAAVVVPLCIAALSAVAAVSALVLVNATHPLAQLLEQRAFPQTAAESLTFAAAGAVLLARRSSRLLGCLFVMASVSVASSALAGAVIFDGDDLPYRAWLHSAIWMLKAPVFVLLLWLVPGGRPPVSRRWLAVSLDAAGTCWFMLASGSYLPRYRTAGTVIDNPLWPGPLLGRPYLVSWILTLSVVAALAARCWRCPGISLRQLTAMVICMPVLLFHGDFAGHFGGTLRTAGLAVVATLVVISIGLAVTAHRRDEVDLALRRGIVGAGLVVGLAAIYLVGFILLSTTSPQHLAGGNTARAAIAAGLAGLAVRPLGNRLSSWADRLFYGDRARPYEVLRSLSDRLRDSPEVAEVPAAVCQTVVRSLRLPAAALQVSTPSGPRELATSGTHDEANGPAEIFRLRYRGEEAGRLIVRPRYGQRSLDERDRAILQSLADQAAPAVFALGLQEELRASRERLVAAREEERRRLRRDLHDGLGPSLAGIQPHLDTARTLMPSGSSAEQLLAGSTDALRQVLTEVRRITEDLRPPALDELGLAGAIEALAAHLSHPSLQVTSHFPAALPTLPAATEVAAYRIAAEALTNVVRHARARFAVVSLTLREQSLLLEIRDDGRGLPAQRRSGIGLRSMRERATEIGGHCTVTSTGSGTTVRAELPRRAVR